MSLECILYVFSELKNVNTIRFVQQIQNDVQDNVMPNNLLNCQWFWSRDLWTENVYAAE